MITIIIGKSGYGKSYFIKNRIIKNWNTYIVFDTQGEYTEYGIPIKNFKDLKRIEYNRAILQFDEFDLYNDFFDWLNYGMTDSNIVIDELGLFVDSKRDIRSLNNIVLTHRHKRFNIILATQSPRFINTIMLTQARYIYLFRLEKAEIDNLRKKISFDIPDEDIMNLNIGEFKSIK